MSVCLASVVRSLFLWALSVRVRRLRSLQRPYAVRRVELLRREVASVRLVWDPVYFLPRAHARVPFFNGQHTLLGV